jgi:hypothetical protein
MYSMLGHDGPPTAFWRENLVTGKPLDRCPLRTLQLAAREHRELAEEVQRYSQDYVPAFEAHHLLVAGGLADQPARYVEIVRRVREIDARTDERYLELTRETPED